METLKQTLKRVKRLPYMVKWVLDKSIYNSHSSKPTEIITGIASLFWGIWLLLPIQSFGTASYAFINSLAPESAWGGFMLVSGSLQLLFAVRGNFHSREVSMKFSALGWAFIATGFILSGTWSTAIPMYTIVSISAYWASLKLVALNNIK